MRTVSLCFVDMCAIIDYRAIQGYLIPSCLDLKCLIIAPFIENTAPHSGQIVSDALNVARPFLGLSPFHKFEVLFQMFLQPPHFYLR